ncbi:MAG: zinc ribbon domain-containing protein [Verrucomicrobia bacterium]|nr:zinc ribbon domain-containing protein [Verrucomicrobiota bacterium]
MNTQQTALLSHGELRWLIDHHKLDVTTVSPLAFAAQQAPEESERALSDRGVLTDDWRVALRVLARPFHQVRALAPGLDSTRIARFYAGPAGRSGELVGCWPSGDGVSISFPWTPRAIADAAGAVVSAALPIPPDPFAATLDPAGLMVLMAAADMIRSAHLNSMIERQPQLDLRFSETDLQDLIARGSAEDDARWLVTLLRLTGPPWAQPGEDALATGLGELAEAQLVKREGDAWEPTGTLHRLAAYWTPSLPAVAHEVVTLDDDNAMQQYKHCIALRGGGPLWLIDFDGLADGQPRATLRSLDGKTYLKAITALVQPPEMPATEPAQEPSDEPVPKPAGVSLCDSCGAPLQPNQGFCSKCGTRVQSLQPRTCPNSACRKPLREGAKFCAACGTRIA